MSWPCSFTCPTCGPREVEELRCAGEVTTRRPQGTPTISELNEYVYFREQRRRACTASGGSAAPARTGSWPSATRVTNEVARTWCRSGRRTRPVSRAREARAPARRADRPVAASSLHVRGQARRGLRRRHDRLGALRVGAADLLPQLQVPPPRGLLCCSGHCPNCQMTVDGIPNVRVCVDTRFTRARS